MNNDNVYPAILNENGWKHKLKREVIAWKGKKINPWLVRYHERMNTNILKYKKNILLCQPL